MIDVSSTMSIIKLIANGPNSPIREQRLSEWIKKHDPIICCL